MGASGSPASIGLYNSDYVAGSAGTALGFATGSSSGSTYSYILASNDGGTVGATLSLNPFGGGSVGVGTSTPGAKLDVNSSTNGSGYGLKVNTDTRTTGEGYIWFGDAGTPDFFVNTSGYVGVGMANPSNRLHVSGSIGATNWVGAGCEVACSSDAGYVVLFADGTISSGTGAALNSSGIWANASDIRLKRNVAAIDYGLETILKLNPVQYDYIRDGKHSIGFIAQEMEKIVPEAVSENRDGIKGIAYGILNSILVKSIQQIYEKLMGHDAQIEQLKQENQALREALCEINPKAAVCQKQAQ